jgi:hypothetical protein
MFVVFLDVFYQVNFLSCFWKFMQLGVKIILRSAHTVYLCVLCGSENKQRLFPYTALTDWFLQLSVFCAVRTGSLYIIPLDVTT